MNFESLTTRLKDKAQAAAHAAKNFKGLDSMAEQDDYIHTDGLNVRRPTRPSHQQPRGDEASMSTTSWSMLDRPSDHDDSQETGSRATINSSRHSIATDALSEASSSRHSVHSRPASLAGSSHNENASVLNSLHDSDNESSSSDSDTESDPILSQLRREKASSLSGSVTKQKKHRFMEDLDHRISQPLEIETPKPVAAPTGTGSPPSVSPTGLVASPWQFWKKIQTPSSIANKAMATVSPPPPLARPKVGKAANNQQSDPEANFTVVSSASMLGTEELQALGRLKASPSRLEQIRQHPREAFVGATLVLSVFFYFFAHSDNL